MQTLQAMQKFFGSGNSFVLCTMLLGWAFASHGWAGPRQQADQIYQRLNGIPPDAETLERLTKMVQKGDLSSAALAAIDDPAGHFYNTIVRNWWTGFTNEAENARAALNDYTALVIGMIRDELPFDEILYGDVLYLAVDPTGSPLPTYSQRGGNDANEHFLAVDERNLKLHQVLKQYKQSEKTSYAPDVAAGVLSTWGFAKDFYNAGTNRAAVRFTMIPFLCRDMEQLHDPTRPDFRIRRDVPRDPGGDTSVYRNKCAGCHAGMDALAGAFSHWDYDDDDGVLYDPTQLPDKINRNGDVFEKGYITKNDNWELLWHEGPNSKVGWNGEKKGFGTKSFGKMISSTDAFARCMAQRTLKLVCQVDTEDSKVRLVIEQLANSFKQKSGGTPYNMKHLFAKSALMCRGE